MSRSMDDDEESEENDAVIGTIFVRSDYGNFLDDLRVVFRNQTENST